MHQSRNRLRILLGPHDCSTCDCFPEFYHSSSLCRSTNLQMSLLYHFSVLQGSHETLTVRLSRQEARKRHITSLLEANSSSDRVYSALWNELANKLWRCSWPHWYGELRQLCCTNMENSRCSEIARGRSGRRCRQNSRSCPSRE